MQGGIVGGIELLQKWPSQNKQSHKYYRKLTILYVF
nr:MAG TPA: hypothetical protein [Bacteriophage sp.]